MDDAKLVARSKAAVLQAMQRYALEQSVEESVNVNPESENAGRQMCAACGSANRKGNSFCANCGVQLAKTPEGAEGARANPKPVPEPPGDHHYHHHYHHHYFSNAGGLEGLAAPEPRTAGGTGASRDLARVRPPLSGAASLSRAETALRKVTQDWALACNVKQLDDLVELYNNALAFVFPSLYEGFGLPPLEAMACGTPVITSNRSSLPEVVGAAALLVDPEDTAELTDAMARIVDEAPLREDLRERGVKQAQGFSWDETARMTVEVYESVLHPQP